MKCPYHRRCSGGEIPESTKLGGQFLHSVSFCKCKDGQRLARERAKLLARQAAAEKRR